MKDALFRQQLDCGRRLHTRTGRSGVLFSATRCWETFVKMLFLIAVFMALREVPLRVSQTGRDRERGEVMEFGWS